MFAWGCLRRKHFDIEHLSTGDILRQAIAEGTSLGQKAKAFIDVGKLLPDEVMIDLIDDRLDCSESRIDGCLLDGFPRTINQAKALDLILAKCEKKITISILLTADRGELLRRLSARAKEGRADDCSSETIQRIRYPPTKDYKHMLKVNRTHLWKHCIFSMAGI